MSCTTVRSGALVCGKWSVTALGSWIHLYVVFDLKIFLPFSTCSSGLITRRGEVGWVSEKMWSVMFKERTLLFPPPPPTLLTHPLSLKHLWYYLVFFFFFGIRLANCFSFNDVQDSDDHGSTSSRMIIFLFLFICLFWSHSQKCLLITLISGFVLRNNFGMLEGTHRSLENESRSAL